MKKLLFLLFIFFLCIPQFAVATPLTLVDQGDQWNYNQFSAPDLWTNWETAGLTSFNWEDATWLTGNAAFGNPYSNGLPYSTKWDANTDLALWKAVTYDGVLVGDVTLNVASDNGFIIFVNGEQIAKANAEGYTSIWEYTYTIDSSVFGLENGALIQVLAEDHGVATYFDMKLTGELAPVPEPATMMLFGIGLLGLAGVYRRKR